MTKNLFDEQGQSVEAFTSEEVEQKLNEAREMAIEETNKLRQEEVDDLSLQIEAKDREREQARQELEVEKSKEKNLAGQGRIIQNKEKKIDELEANIKKMKEEVDQRINGVEAKSREKMVNSMINELSGNDKDMTNKIKFYFDSFKGDPADDNEIQQRIQNAYVLATGAKPTSPLSGAVMSSAGGMPVINPIGEKLSDDAKDLAHKMGLTDQELKRHKLL